MLVCLVRCFAYGGGDVYVGIMNPGTGKEPQEAVSSCCSEKPRWQQEEGRKPPAPQTVLHCTALHCTHALQPAKPLGGLIAIAIAGSNELKLMRGSTWAGTIGQLGGWSER